MAKPRPLLELQDLHLVKDLHLDRGLHLVKDLNRIKENLLDILLREILRRIRSDLRDHFDLDRPKTLIRILFEILIPDMKNIAKDKVLQI